MTGVMQPFGQLPADLREGCIVAGKYRIEKVIGAGAMGVVVSARHLLLEEKVAIKFLLPHAVESREAVARFVREARAAVKIKSEHVARVSDISILENGMPYIVMEFLDGCDLAHWLRQRGPLPIGLAVEFVLQACEALAEAHSQGIVHRDLKPANLFVVERVDGVAAVKVLDFGISKTMQGAGLDGAITDAITVMGSPSYMSPEQMESARDVDARADVWALGAILCELVTGKLPYQGQSLPQVYASIVAGPRPSLRELSPILSDELEAVLLRCLERNRSLRYRNVAELASALMRFAPQRAYGSVDRVSRVFSVGPGVLPDSLPTPIRPPAHLFEVEKTLASFVDSASTPPARSRKVGVVASVVFVVALLAITRSVFPPAGVPAVAEPRARPAAAAVEKGDVLPAAAPSEPPSARPEAIVDVTPAPSRHPETARGPAPSRAASLPRTVSSALPAAPPAEPLRAASGPASAPPSAAPVPATAIDAITPLLKDQK